MIKRIITVSVIAVVYFLLSFFTNQYFIEIAQIILSISLLKVYLFNLVATVFIYVLTEVILKYLPNETGYLYLALMFVKFGVFLLLFQTSIFSETGLAKPEKLSVFVAVFSFLLLEVTAIGKLLTSKDL